MFEWNCTCFRFFEVAAVPSLPRSRGRAREGGTRSQRERKEAAAEKNREKRELTRMRKEENRTRAFLKGMVYIYGVPLASSGWHPEHLGTLLANLDSGRAKAFAQPASVTLLCESVVQRSMAYANRVVLQPEHLPIDHADL